MLIRIVPQAEIQGARGEWAANEDPDDTCFGVARVAKELDPFARWLVFREELQHALIDFQRWILYDKGNDDNLSDRVIEEPTDTGVRESNPSTRV